MIINFKKIMLLKQHFTPLTKKHCVIVPITHISSLVRCDEDILMAIQVIRTLII